MAGLLWVPEMKIFNDILDQYFPLTSVSGITTEYECEITLPPNAGNDPVTYTFELWVNEQLFPKKIDIIVNPCEEVIVPPEYYQVIDWFADQDVFECEGGKVKFTVMLSGIPSWNEVDVPEVLRVGTLYTFLSSKGRVLLSSDQANIGIWTYNLVTHEFIQIYDSGQYWNTWYETKAGDIFVSSSNDPNHATPASRGPAGILKLEGNTLRRVYNTGHYYAQWVESPEQGLFTLSNFDTADAATAIERPVLRFSGIDFVAIKPSTDKYRYHNNIIKTAKGDVLIYSNSASTTADEAMPGLKKWNGSNFVLTGVIDTLYGLSVYPLPSGITMISSTVAANTGIWKLENDVVMKAHGAGINWRFQEVSNGAIFASVVGNIAGSEGIWAHGAGTSWTGTSFSQVFAENYNFVHSEHFRELPNGDILTSCQSNVGSDGILVLKQATGGAYMCVKLPIPNPPSANNRWLLDNRAYYDETEKTLFTTCAGTLTYGILAIAEDGVRKVFDGTSPNNLQWRWWKLDRETNNLTVSYSTALGILSYDRDTGMFTKVGSTDVDQTADTHITKYSGNPFGPFSMVASASAGGNLMWNDELNPIRTHGRYNTNRTPASITTGVWNGIRYPVGIAFNNAVTAGSEIGEELSLPIAKMKMLVAII